MKTVKQLQEELNAKQDALHKFFEDHKTAEGYDMTPEQVENVRQMNAELNDLGVALEEAKELDETYQKNAKAIQDANRASSNLPINRGDNNGSKSGTPGQIQVKTLGENFVESEAYQGRQRKRDINVQLPEFDFMQSKTLMETGAGFAPETIRSGRIVPYAHRRPMVADLIPQTPIESAAIAYMEETTFTNNAATVAEGGLKPESALAFTERVVPVIEIATWLPVTEIQLEDAPVVRSLIDNRLTTMLDLVEEVELMTGDGTSTHIDGFLNKTGVQSQAKGADPTPDAVYKAMTKVRFTGFAEPSAVVFHPNDWQDIRLLRTTDGIYIWGSPAEAGPERIWGLPAVITVAETENTALLGDFQLYSEIFRRRGATIKVSDSHSDYFIYDKLAIRADKRLTMAIYRAAAFCKVTGI